MKSLTPELVTTVQNELTGKRLEKFNESVRIINESLSLNGWTPRGSVKSNSGFYQGCGIKMPYHYGQGDAAFALHMCLAYGSPCGVDVLDQIHRLFSTPVVKKHTVAFVKAWVALCMEKYEAMELLNSYRPLPVITAIGLSPKVTATLKEMALDINLPSIKMAEIKYHKVPALDRKGHPRFNQFGERMMDSIPYVAWTPGTVFGKSRFDCGCQACGKRIPSGMYVPIEADDLKSGDHCGFWIGCDCARNIFGVKDQGIELPQTV
jgi:hypothetical protein